MRYRSIIISIAVLALITMACGVTFNLPVTEIKTGPTITKDIQISVPEETTEPVDLTFSFGAGELKLAPGAQGWLVDGTATYNVKDLEPQITISDNKVLLESGDLEINGIPNFKDDLKNEWDLTLGNILYDLTINSGAYRGRFELGGLSLNSLQVTDGASDVYLSFNQPNLVEMDVLRYETGASSVELVGLANANFDQMVFKAGAGNYTLDFSGDLQRDATVTIDSGLSNTKLVVPAGVSARVMVDGGLSNVDIGGAWEKSGNTYVLSGDGPRLTINVNIGAGTLELSN